MQCPPEKLPSAASVGAAYFSEVIHGKVGNYAPWRIRWRWGHVSRRRAYETSPTASSAGDTATKIDDPRSKHLKPPFPSQTQPSGKAANRDLTVLIDQSRYQMPADKDVPPVSGSDDARTSAEQADKDRAEAVAKADRAIHSGRKREDTETERSVDGLRKLWRR